MYLADEEKMWLILLILGHANIFLMDMAFRIFFARVKTSICIGTTSKEGLCLHNSGFLIHRVKCG
jgi:hypothetical protein